MSLCVIQDYLENSRLMGIDLGLLGMTHLVLTFLSKGQLSTMVLMLRSYPYLVASLSHSWVHYTTSKAHSYRYNI